MWLEAGPDQAGRSEGMMKGVNDWVQAGATPRCLAGKGLRSSSFF